MIKQSFEDLTQSLAAKTPTPGGGAAAAMSIAMGAALLLMVVRFSRGKKANIDRDADLEAAESTLADYLQKALPMAQKDCDSFDGVSAAYGLPKETEADKEARSKAIEDGMVGAMIVPEETLALARDVLVAVDNVVSCIGKNIVSDLGSGAELLRAGAIGAFMNVRINAAYLKNRELAETALSRSQAVRDEVESRHGAIAKVVSEHLA